MPLLSNEKRRELGEKAVDHVGAGAVEFIVNKSTGKFFLMEMKNPPPGGEVYLPDRRSRLRPFQLESFGGINRS